MYTLFGTERSKTMPSGKSPHRPYRGVTPTPSPQASMLWKKQLPPFISVFLFTFRYIPDLNAFIKRSRNNQSCFEVKAATKSIVLMTKEDFDTRFSEEVPNSNTGVIWGRDEKATFWIPAHFRHFQLVTLQRCLQISWDAPYFNEFVGGRRSYKLSVRTKFDARDSFTMRCNWYFFFNVKFIATFGQFIIFIHGNQRHQHLQPPFCYQFFPPYPTRYKPVLSHDLEARTKKAKWRP